MDELKTQIQAELSAITDFLEERLGRRSRWNGEVELSSDAAAFGKARWSGAIILNRLVAESDLRWRTEIHELLHTFSTGLGLSDYLNLPGWEEGVVEQLQRSLRPEVLSRLSARVPEVIFVSVESGHEYNRYIAALDKLRNVLNAPTQEAFYQELLATPLKDRPKVIIQAGRRLPPDQFHGFQREFGLAFSILRGD